MEMHPPGLHVTVRNTFIEVEDDDEDDPLFRTASDPMGGQSRIQARHTARALMPKKGVAVDQPLAMVTEDQVVQDDSWSNQTGDGLPTMESVVAQVLDDPLDLPLSSTPSGAPDPELTRLISQLSSTNPAAVPPMPFPGMYPPFLGMPGMPLFPMPLFPPDDARGGAHPFSDLRPPFPTPGSAGLASYFNGGAGSLLSMSAALTPTDFQDGQPAYAGPKGRGHKGGGKGKARAAVGQTSAYGASDPERSAVPLPVGVQGIEPCLTAATPSRPSDGPPMGKLHRFHAETAKMGTLSYDGRIFTKQEFKGRLSVITEHEIHSRGVMRYAVQFTEGELSSADGVGFIFSTKLPCPKNIQKIVSIFANRTGRICVRAQTEVVRSDISVKAMELGDWLEMVIDLEEQRADFTVWPSDGSMPSSASLAFGETLDSLRRNIPSLPKTNCGYLAVVVKHTGVTVTLGS